MEHFNFQRRYRCFASVLIWFVVSVGTSYGGSNQVTPQGQPKHWKTNTPILYAVNPGGVPGLTGDLQKFVVLGAVNDAFRAWTEIPGASIAFTTEGVSGLTNAAVDGTNLVSFQDRSFSFAPGVLAVAVVVSATATGPTQVGNKVINAEFAGQILDTDIVFNPNPQGGSFSPIGTPNSIDLVAVGTHEVGHLLGLDHTGVHSSIMNPFAEQSGTGVASRTIQTDDAITAAAVYPAATFAASRGSISGTITGSAGSPIKSAHIIAVQAPGGVPVASQVSGPDGKYLIAGLPPGNYQVLVEPLDGPIGLGNLQAFYANGESNLATTFLGGLGSPASISVSAGQSATANIALPTTPSSPLNINLFGTATQPTPTSILFTPGSPVFVPRGKSYQIFASATNQTSDSNLTFLGSGFSLQAASSGNFTDGRPFRLQNVTVSSTASLGPSNVFLSNPASTSAFPGGVVVTVSPTIEGIVDAAAFTPALAPGSLFSIFSLGGKDLAFGRGPGGLESWLGAPAPTSLGGVSVKVGDRYAPLFFVFPTQINGMIPYEVSGSVDVTVVTGPGANGNTFKVSLSPTAPGIFSADSSGKGQGAILNGLETNQGIASLVAPLGSFPNAHPAKPGDVIIFYASGLGPVTSALPSGLGPGISGVPFPTCDTPKVFCMATFPQVLIGGQPATVLFAGIAPYFPGLYQLNVTVPSIAANAAAPVTIKTVEGQTSNTVTIAVGP